MELSELLVKATKLQQHEIQVIINDLEDYLLMGNADNSTREIVITALRLLNLLADGDIVLINDKVMIIN